MRRRVERTRAKPKALHEAIGLVLLGLALLSFVSLVTFDPQDSSLWTSNPNTPPENAAGEVGVFISSYLFFTIGYSAFLIPLILFIWGWGKFIGKKRENPLLRTIGIFVLVFSTSSSFSMLEPYIPGRLELAGGVIGHVVADVFLKHFKSVSYLIEGVLILFGVVLAGDFSLLRAFFLLKRSIFFLIREIYHSIERRGILKKRKKKRTHQKGEVKEKIILTPQTSSSIYQPPPLSLLKSHQSRDKQAKDELLGGEKLLEETLNNFGIDAKVTQTSVGPVVTRFEIQPAPGVKVSSITALSDDIALALAAQSVRIETPVPGKQALGIEVPNRRRRIVFLKEVLSSNEYKNLNSKLSIGLGKDISGGPVVVDLRELPHLLIAGATGSGKTICINCIITSILYKARPDEVKLLLIDPKRVELTIFSGIPHLLTPIVTDPKEAGFVLRALVDEMEERYRLFATCGVRDVESFYKRAEEEGASKIPYIVMIIDELADLMMVAQRDFEDAVIRLAQMARAVGIHLVLATQRPSVDILTGLIKANFPSRIAFQVSSKVDSRTILDMIGAEKLLGRGDMLFSLPNLPKPIRVQGCYISNTELEEVVSFIKLQEWQEEYHYEFKRKIEYRREGREEEEEEEEDLFHDALRIIVEEGRASTSLLQRRLRIGYNRAARLIDRLEEKGFISPADGSKPREVLVSDDFLEKHYGKQIDND